MRTPSPILRAPILVACAFFISACGGGTDSQVTQLPDRDSRPVQHCEVDDDCEPDAYCQEDDLCGTVWGSYFVAFTRIAIPETAETADADGSPPDVGCTLLRDNGSGNHDAGATSIVPDLYEGELDGGGYNEIGPTTTFRVRCYEGEGEEVDRLIGEACVGPASACTPITRDVLRGEDVELQLSDGAFHGVVVNIRFELVEQ